MILMPALRGRPCPKLTTLLRNVDLVFAQVEYPRGFTIHRVCLVMIIAAGSDMRSYDPSHETVVLSLLKAVATIVHAFAQPLLCSTRYHGRTLTHSSGHDCLFPPPSRAALNIPI
jgi:hypothetical protein